MIWFCCGFAVGAVPPFQPSQILGDGPAFGGRAGRVVRDHAGGFPVAGQHDFRGGRAARRQFGREPDPATVRRHARLDAGGAGGRGEAALNLQRRQPDHPICGGGVGGGAKGADRFRRAVFEIAQDRDYAGSDPSLLVSAAISLFSYAPLAGVKLFVGFIRPEEPLTIEVDEVVWRISHPDLGLPSDLGQVLAHRSAGEECRHEH